MTNETAPVNRLILGDNLEIMKTLESESVEGASNNSIFL